MSLLRRFQALRHFDPSFLLAIVGTVLFYGVVLQPSMRGSTLTHYTTEHEVEYVIVVLFIWGLVDITLKLLCLPREYMAAHHAWLPARVGREPAGHAESLLQSVRKRPRWLTESRMGQRLIASLTFVTEKGSAEDYAEHIRYLSDQDHSRSHSNYVLLRFAIAVTPILGFLGTVVHFGSAIGQFSFTEMDDKLPAVVGGLGTAFNTTTVALAASMILMFATFLCERVESGILTNIDRLVDCDLLNRFEVKDANVVPFLSSLRSAHEETLHAITATLQRQTEGWTQALDSLFARFDSRQQRESDRWEECLTTLQQRHDAYDSAREERVRQLISLVDTRNATHMSELQAAVERAMSFRNDVAELSQTLNSIARGEGRLVELQCSLTENLRVLQETGQIDGALHGLTGAIHLLTARNPQINVHDRAA